MAFMLAEATLSSSVSDFQHRADLGTMLQDASNVALLGDAPWSLRRPREFSQSFSASPACAEPRARAA